jgi:hypothetical protein
VTRTLDELLADAASRIRRYTAAEAHAALSSSAATQAT